MKSTKCAVLMGDIIMSRKSEDLSEIHKIFNKEITKINKVEHDEIISPMTITLGDEFQGLVVSLQDAFRVAIKTRFSLMSKEVNCRFVIGEAEIETKVNSELSWNMMGPGLAEARQLLGDKQDYNCYRFSMINNLPESILLNAVGMGLTILEARWTKTQLDYVTHIILSEGLTREQMAKKLNIAENTLYKVLRAADFHFYVGQIEAVMKVLGIIDERNGYLK